ncbi:MAG TPA: hypothetical protein VH044_08180 [Polyangiaceae bacterium]|jgi:hypothetical protein|nr:hypothetical protein [Polyangiaceae bacterium]
MTTGVLLLPALLQMLAMLFDEGVFHRKRGLPRWERLGHPLDTLTVAACYAWLVANRPGRHALAMYVGLAGFSCLFITKDEFVHARYCEAGEGWLHAVLFVLHPIVFLAFGVLWYSREAGPGSGQLGAFILRAQLVATLAFCVYQVLYWSVPWKKLSRSQAITDPSTTTSTRR